MRALVLHIIRRKSKHKAVGAGDQVLFDIGGDEGPQAKRGRDQQADHEPVAEQGGAP